MTLKANPGKNGNPLSRPHHDPLAVERNELALERTHLSWVRTVIALMTAGFAIDKVVDSFRQKKLITSDESVRHAHITGLVLTITGTVLIIVVTVYYIKRSIGLARMQQARLRRMVPGIVLSVFIFLISLVLVYLVATSD